MKNIIRTIICSLAVAAFFGSGCSEKNQQIKLISQQGIDDARRMLEIAPTLSTTSLEFELLEIRARENDYRQQMGNAQADAYIEAFETIIRQENDSLATLLFTPVTQTDYAD